MSVILLKTLSPRCPPSALSEAAIVIEKKSNAATTFFTLCVPVSLCDNASFLPRTDTEYEHLGHKFCPGLVCPKHETPCITVHDSA